MLLGLFTLSTAVIISCVSAYYSVLGLTAIFAAAFWPVVIMGGALELGKLAAAVWLHSNWTRASVAYKLYLVPAILFLMLLTSMGVFGFLSKAHSDQGLVTGDAVDKLAIYEERIKVSRENIDTNRKALAQLDQAVDQIMGRSSTESGASKAISIRKSQTTERNRLLADIQAEQNKIAQLNEEASPLRANVRKVEAEVGPIKYIASFIYGASPDSTMLEKAVSWVIILIVVVFDPLAIVLILAGIRQTTWSRPKPDSELVVIDPATDEAAARAVESKEEPVESDQPASITDLTPELTQLKNDHDRLLERNSNMIRRTVELEEQLRSITDQLLVSQIEKSGLEAKLLDIQAEHANTLLAEEVVETVEGFDPNTRTQIRNQVTHYPEPMEINYGTHFPAKAMMGECFIRIDSLPGTVYKFNGTGWIRIDKNSTSSYLTPAYISFLASKLLSGEIELTTLTEDEIQEVTDYLNAQQSNNPS